MTTVKLTYTLPGSDKEHEFTTETAGHPDGAIAKLIDEQPEAEVIRSSIQDGKAPALDQEGTNDLKKKTNEYVAAPWRLPEILRILGVMGPLVWVLYGVAMTREIAPPNMASVIVSVFIWAFVAGLAAFVLARIIELLEGIEKNSRKTGSV
ncbi:hypothetical protein [Thioalkalivibrio sp. ALE16]|uniref:hypothetical protein n=1 Tax=Thioalkalivibrio sp. ALE16 TaxID=1158172 RepID=UPI0003658A95|nr:hypothetical protein [Thioalkalivibrio sp. ALE16]